VVIILYSLKRLLDRLLKDEEIIGIVVFGKCLSIGHQEVLCLPLDQLRNSLEESDIDLLIFTKRKSLAIMSYIEEALRHEDIHIVFHPDFYSVRPSDKVTFDIIVVPRGTRWFSRDNLGRLIGLSIFSSEYILLSDYPIEKLLVLPKKADSMSERINLVLKGYGGLYYFITGLWSAIGNKNLVDARRILKWAIIDTVWALEGKFIRDDPYRCVDILNSRLGDICEEYGATLDIFLGKRRVNPSLQLMKDVYGFIEFLIGSLRQILSEG